MGQAKKRGTFEQRQAAALQKSADERAEREAAQAARRAELRALEAALPPSVREQRRGERHRSMLLRAQMAGLVASVGMSLETMKGVYD